MRDDLIKGALAAATGLSIVASVVLIRPALGQDALPDSPGKDVMVASCSACHSPNRVIGHREDADQWAYTVNSMIGLGAKVSDPETVVKYLTANFGPTAGAAGAAGAKQTLAPVQAAGGAGEVNEDDGTVDAPINCQRLIDQATASVNKLPDGGDKTAALEALTNAKTALGNHDDATCRSFTEVAIIYNH